MQAVIKSIKHYVHQVVTSPTTATNAVVILVDAIAEGVSRSAASSVYEGCVVKAVYLDFWVSATTDLKTGTWVVLKRPANVAAPTAAEMINLGSYLNKKNIFNSGQGLLPTNGNVMNIYKGWIKIPKGKQRFGLGDKLQLIFTPTGTTGHLCGLSTYKEYE